VPEAVRQVLADSLVDQDRVGWVRAALGALQLARTAGCEPRRVVSDDVFQMTAQDGSAFLLAPLAIDMPAHPRGETEDVQRLYGALDQAFGDRRYVLYLRRAVPGGLQAEPIARAVHLWLKAIERGEWQGQHAIYEDDAVSLELTLTGERSDASRGVRSLTIGPVLALERLAEVDALIVDQATVCEESIGAMPVVFALSAPSPWRMPRGYVEQLLYGTADWVSATSGSECGYEAGFSANGRSLFSDPSCRHVMALWWLMPDPADALGFASMAHDNPWSAYAELVPPVDGLRFVSHGIDEDEVRRRESVVLRWTGSSALWSHTP